MKTLLMTTREVARVVAGQDVTVSTLDGERYIVRVFRLDPDVQDDPEGLPQMMLGFDQLRAIATGGGAVFGFVETRGDSPEWIAQVNVRLAAQDEEAL